MNKQEAIDKAKKLLNLKNGAATEGELEAAGAALQRILQTYNLEMSEVEREQIDDDIVQVAYDTGYATQQPWLLNFAGNIASGMGCDVIGTLRRNLDGKKQSMMFIGPSLAVELAKYYFDLCYNHLWYKANDEARKLGYKGYSLTEFRQSFMVAASRVIMVRLKAEYQQQATTQSNALVVASRAAIDAFKKQHFPKLREGRAPNLTEDGWEEGKRAGRTLGLHKGMSGSNPTQKLLGSG